MSFPVHNSPIKNLPPYLLGSIAEEIRSMHSRGEEVIDLSQINPDLTPPEIGIESLVQASLRAENHRYSSTRGIRKLRQEVCELYKRKFSVELDWKSEVACSMGTKEGLMSILFSVVGGSGSVILPSPYYPVHNACIYLLGAQVIEVPLFEAWPKEKYLKLDVQGFLKRLDIIYQSTWPRPKAMVLSFPHNPTSATAEREDFEAIIDFAKNNSIFIVHDFAYLGVEFDDYKAPSILEVPGAKNHAVELFSLSKGFSLPGWRVGFCLSSKEVIETLVRAKSYTDFGIFQPLQIATAALLESAESILHKNSDIYYQRSQTLTTELKNAGWSVYTPKAGVFVWAKPPKSLALKYVQASRDNNSFSGLETCETTCPSRGIAENILKETGVALSPGLGFGERRNTKEPEDIWLRFALVAPCDKLKEAVKRLT